MSEERKRVLEMLAAGKITSDEAEQLLGKLESRAAAEDASPPAGERRKSAPAKYLRVLVDSKEGDKVNIRVPLALVRTGIKLTTVLPKVAGDRLKEEGFDLSHLNELHGDELMQAIEELTVDIDSPNGDTVRVFCE